MTCPNCKIPMKAVLDIEGGCCGNHGSDGYCYCPSKDVNVTFYCRTCYKHVKVSDLSSQYSIATWVRGAL